MLAKAALWVDASVADTVQFVEGSTEQVRQWLDCREPDVTVTGEAGAYAYTRLVAYTNVSQHASEDVATWFPTYVAAANGANAYLDFGGYGSGQNLRCRDAQGKETRVWNVKWAFAVYGTEDYKWGFLFSEKGSSFVPGNYSQKAFSETAYYAHLNDSDNTKRIQTGRFRCDREIVNPLTTSLTEGFHLIDFPIPMGDFHVEGVFDNLGNAGRQGGGRLCEIVLFSVDLSEAERVAVENYLYRKWVDRTPEVNLTVGAAATVRLDGESDARLNVEGAGCLVKTGVGTLTGGALDGQEAAAPQRIRLESGAIDSPRAVALVAAAAATYETATGKVARTSATADGTLTKTGDEDLRVASLADDVQAIDVQSGVLRLMPLEAGDLPADLVGAIEDPSFEAFADQNINSASYIGKELDTASALHGWKGTGAGTQKPYVVKWNEAGGYFNEKGVPFPDGDHAMVLHIDAGCQTTVTLPSAGVYRLSLWAAARPNNANYLHGEFRVSVDGMPVAQIQTATTTYRKYAFRLPYLAAGAHTLVFQADSQNNKSNNELNANLVCQFDDVQVDWLASDNPGAAVANGSFELNAFQSRALVSTNAVESWTVSETGDASGVYLVSADSPALALGASASVKVPEIPEGGRALVLSGTPKLTGAATFTQAGTYRLTFSLGGWWEKDKVTTLPTLGFKLGEQGALLDDTATVSLSSRYPQTFTLGPIAVTEDDLNVAQTLEIAGLTAGAVAFLDDVRLVRMTAAGSTRLVNSFASDGWTKVEPASEIHDGSGAVLWMTKDDIAWGSVRYDDDCRVGIRNRGAIHRTERLTAGTYRLTVASLGRFFRYNDQPEALVQCYSDNRFEAWFGTTDGAVTNVIGQFGVTHAERWQQHAFYFTVPEDGDWLIGFRGLRESDASFDGQHVWSHGGLLDGLVIEPAEIAAPTPLRADLAIRVAKGAQLALDAPVTNAVAEVRLGGRRRSGLITAERFPEFITGPGALEVPRRGAVVILR